MRHIIIIVIFYFHLNKETIGTVQWHRITETVGCQKSICWSSWPPIITFTCIVNIQTFIPTFTQTHSIIYKQVIGPNNSIVNHARKLLEVTDLHLCSLLQFNNSNNAQPLRRFWTFLQSSVFWASGKQGTKRFRFEGGRDAAGIDGTDVGKVCPLPEYCVSFSFFISVYFYATNKFLSLQSNALYMLKVREVLSNPDGDIRPSIYGTGGGRAAICNAVCWGRLQWLAWWMWCNALITVASINQSRLRAGNPHRQTAYRPVSYGRPWSA